MTINYNLIGTFIFIFYFFIYFFLTQKIYSNNYFLASLFCMSSIALALYYITNMEHRTHVIIMCSMFFIYLIVLFIIKTTYKHINNLLTNKQIIDNKYSGKDFTFVITSEFGKDNWSKRLASKPSWIDYLLSVFLLIFPILLPTIILH